MSALRGVPYRLGRQPVVVCVDADATDSDSRAIRRHDRSVFLEFADVAPFVARGSTVLDLGAHLGLAALWYLAAGHPVTSFEPAAANLHVLEATRERNGFAQWTIVPAAVSDRDATARFIADGPHGHLVGPAGPAAGAQSVRTVALDAWLREHPPAAPVGLVKVDVEGAELDVLAGARELLSRPDAPPLFIESNGHCLHWFGQDPTTLRTAIAGYGYALFGVRSQRPLRPTTFYPVDPHALQARCVLNYFCVKDVGALRTAGARIAERAGGTAELVRDIARTLRGNDDERRYLERILPQFPEVCALPAVRALLDGAAR